MAFNFATSSQFYLNIVKGDDYNYFGSSFVNDDDSPYLLTNHHINVQVRDNQGTLFAAFSSQNAAHWAVDASTAGGRTTYIFTDPGGVDITVLGFVDIDQNAALFVMSREQTRLLNAANNLTYEVEMIYPNGDVRTMYRSTANIIEDIVQ